MYRQLSMGLILIWSASGLTQHLPSLPSHTTGESHSLMLTEESTEVIKRRSYSMSADTFGIESNAVNERVPDHPELLEVWWAGWGNYCLPIFLRCSCWMASAIRLMAQSSRAVSFGD
ncbi:uncharacterized protein LOC110910360 [Helianthus annuus]|uniref:uncharacterized protein LOC110910360 n=1 Tax=Helianthus annuus TaxID=4232 RepID=UPI000B909849|nr:uncharacterized protein LOC110910360 [Helianthus annuus]